MAVEPTAKLGVTRSKSPAFALAAMLLGVLIVYIPLPLPHGDRALVGIDYLTLHLYRIRFAQEAIFGPHPHLPAWYPRELMGTPFWSNVQSFPFIPTRLLLLLIVRDPLLFYAAAINLAASLSAWFTFLYARKIGLSAIAAAVAGWTFACSGFFAARVLAGHLPLLEAFPALPLLLWLLERCRSRFSSGKGLATALISLGVACGCVSLAGHPQIPIYAIFAAFCYAIYRFRVKSVWRVAAAMALGCGAASFALWPMWLLIRRSARMLPLLPSADNGFPYERLIGFLFPFGFHQAPSASSSLLHNDYFWETFCYVGWLPILGAIFLLSRTVMRRKLPAPPWTFVAAMGIVALFLALPLARIPFIHLSGTFLRSPSRLVYLTVFSLAMGMGAIIELLANQAKTIRIAGIVLLVIVLVHGFDLGHVVRQFVRVAEYLESPGPTDRKLIEDVGDGRVAIDFNFWTPLNRRIDDVGYFDSIALGSSYKAMLDLGQKPADLNSEFIYGSEMSDRALAACGVRLIKTATRIAYVPNPAPRVAFFPVAATRTLNPTQIASNLRDSNFDLSRWLMIPSQESLGGADSTLHSEQLAYQRNGDDPEDDITMNVKASETGYVRWLEAYDKGWHARLDGVPTQVLPADNLFVAVFVPPGPHQVRLTYSTPGTTFGAILSVICSFLLLIVAFLPVVHNNPKKPDPA